MVMLSTGCRQCCSGLVCCAVLPPRAEVSVLAVSCDLESCLLESSVSAVAVFVGCPMFDGSEIGDSTFESASGGGVNGSEAWYDSDAGLVGVRSMLGCCCFPLFSARSLL